MHDRQVAHRDLKAPNILIDGSTGNPVLIDLVGITTDRRVSDRERVRNLARLNASFAQSAQVSRTDRWRFLRAYLDQSVERNVLKSWWKGVADATAVKVRKNLQSGRPLG
jgi:serine/threonine protein kinase